MKKEGQLSSELPAALRTQFARLERKLWWVDSIISLSGVALGLFLSYMVFFVADLATEMPMAVRLLLFGTAAASTAYFAWYWLSHWVINKRGSHTLANLVQKRYRKLGDRLLGIVELANPKTAPAYASEGAAQGRHRASRQRGRGL